MVIVAMEYMRIRPVIVAMEYIQIRYPVEDTELRIPVEGKGVGELHRGVYM